jgi:phosphatidylserine/phosphatidylglycerophosphate/cardiolipin synthase-like enzyme
MWSAQRQGRATSTARSCRRAPGSTSRTERIIIVSPYFIPNEALLLAITTACQRGPGVELFVCEDRDQAVVWHAQRSYYEALLRAGVLIWW